jgi:hypothetical protein
MVSPGREWLTTAALFLAPAAGVTVSIPMESFLILPRYRTWPLARSRSSRWLYFDMAKQKIQ